MVRVRDDSRVWWAFGMADADAGRGSSAVRVLSLGGHPGRAPQAREPGSMCPCDAAKHAESHPPHRGIWIPARLASLAVRDDSRGWRSAGMTAVDAARPDDSRGCCSAGMTAECGARLG